ncbi:serine/threonine protein kinase [Microbispora sp. RL4-1S]|uniref:non-specific serine/threonine protein kinase n=1 Tax=Microbispora oryzae TaxID=2806554 RepID=A0A940WGC8_9ACTN|nr:serine/threonine-protein kinase [Microbispora oryzae]MBP2705154.1 serine/threonine protein kinase [Microbispora oryzae]
MNRPELKEGDVLTRRYQLTERIATGGMAVIWRAFDQALQRVVAIKVLDGTLDGDHPGRELMRREARATARLIHPDATEVYDYGETVTNGGRLAAYVVMRLMEGRPLSDRIAEGPLPWAEAAAVASAVARVLAEAHDRGIVHRDVTPENVLLAPDGPKLLDFGIAAFIGESDDQLVADFGTPPYVAPERLRGATADPAVDVYALGVLLFEMLTGRPPYPETTWEAVEAACREGPAPRPSGTGLPPEVADVCQRCLSSCPEDRPSARAVADALDAAVKKRPAPRGGGPGWGAAVAGAAALGVALVFSQMLPLRGGASTGAPLTPPAPRQTPSAAATVDGPTIEQVNVPVSTTAPPQHHALRVSPTSGHRTAGDPGSLAANQEVSTLPLATTAAPLRVAGAVRAFGDLVDAAEASHEIDPDVALDLKQVLRNEIDSGHGTEVVQEKLAVRAREGRLPDEVRQDLERALVKIESARAQASGT